MTDEKIYTLSGVTKGIERIIEEYCSKPLWIKAEIVKLNYYERSGHCYPDLVEKAHSKTVAQIRGSIWRSNYMHIRKKFMEVVNEPPGDGMTVVFRATVKFHSVYGLSLNITDIDHSYTLGELARQKAEAIRRLRSENVFDQNKTKPLPMIPKRLAVISVNTSKGYEDFINVLQNNSWGYVFHHALFPAVLQGEKAIETIQVQLDRIREYAVHFDAVAIIRGGGGDVGLSCYDDYSLSRNMAMFPLPVLTGIGHAANQTVCEMVSCKSFITPTKVAEYLVQKYHNVAVPLDDAVKIMSARSEKMLEAQEVSLNSWARLFSSLADGILIGQNSALSHFRKQITEAGKHRIPKQKDLLSTLAATMQYHCGKNLQNQHYELKYHMEKARELCQRRLIAQQGLMEKKSEQLTYQARSLQKETAQKLEYMEGKVNMLKPVNILKRGFSITRVNGKALSGCENLSTKEVIETELAHGIVTSSVIKTQNK